MQINKLFFGDKTIKKGDYKFQNADKSSNLGDSYLRL